MDRYPRWAPHYNPVPFMEPGWKLDPMALGVLGWADITLELIRRLTSPSTPSSVTSHFVMRGRPALRFKRKLIVDVIMQTRGARGGRGQIGGEAALRSYDRWARRARDYGLERVDLYDPHHQRNEGWFALDLNGAYDALWAILGVPHPLETEFPPYGGRGLGEEREFDLLEDGRRRLNEAYHGIVPRRARKAFDRQLERHSLFYTSEGSEDEDLLPPERTNEEGQYVRHYSIYPETRERIAASDEIRAKVDKSKISKPKQKRGCPECGKRGGVPKGKSTREGTSYVHAEGCSQ